MLSIFEQTRVLRRAEALDGDLYPKYLSAKQLFKLQIADPKWREVVLIQTSIFLLHLLSYSSNSEYKPPHAKGLSVSLINLEQVRGVFRTTKTLGILD